MCGESNNNPSPTTPTTNHQPLNQMKRYKIIAALNGGQSSPLHSMPENVKA
jgi:hypothetical protein